MNHHHSIVALWPRSRSARVVSQLLNLADSRCLINRIQALLIIVCTDSLFNRQLRLSSRVHWNQTLAYIRLTAKNFGNDGTFLTSTSKFARWGLPDISSVNIRSIQNLVRLTDSGLHECPCRKSVQTEKIKLGSLTGLRMPYAPRPAIWFQILCPEF